MTINRARLEALLAREREQFTATHPRSQALFERARKSLLGGVPMNWMERWPGGFPIFVEEANGAHFIDVDGHELRRLLPRRHGRDDRSLARGHGRGDRRSARGAASRTMLPTEDAIWVGEELARRFGLPFWQIDDDGDRRQPLRHPPGAARDGTVEDPRLQLVLPRHRRRDARDRCSRGVVGLAQPATSGRRSIPRETTKVVEFNDLDALEAALAHGDVACVLAEPALTNIGIVHPRARASTTALREITRRTGTLLVIDETHTISVGPGGCTRAWGLDPDILVDRQADRGRHARGASTDYRRSWPTRIRAATTDERPTPAGSAARSRATRCRSRRCGRRSSTC